MSSSDLLDGMKRGAIVALSSGPFGILFGVLAVDNGFTPFEAVLMSATVFAGASQIVGIELFGQNIPAWVVILSVFAVNFRHILYSAAMTPLISHFSLLQKLVGFHFLVDPQFAESLRRGESGRPITFTWYMAMGLVVYVNWMTTTFVGAVFGGLIGDPHALGFDVLPAMYFLGMVIGFRSRANFYPVVAASAVSSIVALHLVGSPWHVSIGAAVGILVAAVLAPANPEPEPQPPQAGAEREV